MQFGIRIFVDSKKNVQALCGQLAKKQEEKFIAGVTLFDLAECIIITIFRQYFNMG